MPQVYNCFEPSPGAVVVVGADAWECPAAPPVMLNAVAIAAPTSTRVTAVIVLNANFIEVVLATTRAPSQNLSLEANSINRSAGASDIRQIHRPSRSVITICTPA